MFQDIESKNCSPELLAKIADIVDSAVIISQKGNLGTYDHKIVYTNKAFCSLSGYSEREILGRSPDFLCDQRSDPEGILEFYKSCHFDHGFETEFQSYRRNGEGYKAKIQVSPISEEGSDIQHYIILFSEITCESAQEQQTTEPQPEAEISEIKEEEFDKGYNSILEEISAELKTINDDEPEVEDEDDEIDLDHFETDDDDLKEEYKLQEASPVNSPEIQAIYEEDNMDENQEFFSQLGEILDIEATESERKKEKTLEEEILSEGGEENIVELQTESQKTLQEEISQEEGPQESTEEIAAATGQIAELLRSIEKGKKR